MRTAAKPVKSRPNRAAIKPIRPPAHATAGKATAGKGRRSRRWIGRLVASIGVAAALGPLLLILLFRFLPVPLTPLMVVRLAEGYGLHRHWVPYSRLAPSLVNAVIASEDNLFCRERFGIDWNALAGQFAVWDTGERPRGASTITMQTARNLLLWQGRDPVRKAIEAWLTPQIALLWPKKRVLEVYLNIIEFGPGIYGADAAAHAFFGRSAAGLTAEQADRLAVVLPDPLAWSAVHPSAYLRDRADTIGHRVPQLGALLDCAR